MGKRRTIATSLRWIGCFTTVLLTLTFVVTGLVVFKFFAGAVQVGNGGIVFFLEDHRASGPVIDIDSGAPAGWSIWLPGGFAEGSRAFFILPLWIPLILAATPPLIVWLVWTYRKDNRLAGKCAKCKYDRKGLTADAICPECGLVPSAPDA